MPQHRVHGRRPRLRGAADLAADTDGSQTAPAGQPTFGHPSVLPRSDVHGDRIDGSVRVEAAEPACAGLEQAAGAGLTYAFAVWLAIIRGDPAEIPAGFFDFVPAAPTIEGHVRSALAKLQLTNRTELAAWVLQSSQD